MVVKHCEIFVNPEWLATHWQLITKLKFEIPCPESPNPKSPLVAIRFFRFCHHIFCHHMLENLSCVLSSDRITCKCWLVDKLFISETKIYVSEITKFVRAWNIGVTLSEVNNQMRFDKILSWWHILGSEIKYFITLRSLDVAWLEVKKQLRIPVDLLSDWLIIVDLWGSHCQKKLTNGHLWDILSSWVTGNPLVANW